MDSVSQTEPQAPVLPPRKNNWSLVIGLVVILLLLIVGVGIYENYTKSSGLTALLPAGTSVLMRESIGTPSPLQNVNLATGSTTPVTVAGMPKGSWVLDEVHAGSLNYYNILNPQTLSSNIFSKSASATTLTQITSTASFKYDLGYDSSSKQFVYSALAITSTTTPATILTPSPWSIVTYNVATHAEKIIDSGNNPVILPGGSTVIFQRSNNLYAVNTTSLHEYQLLAKPDLAPYAVNASGTQVVIYNTATKSLDYYKIVNMNSVSYVRSTKDSTQPLLMSYVNSSLAYLLTPSPNTYLLQIDGSPKTLPVKLSPGEQPQLLEFIYGS